jgi:hypothetical protein
MSSAMTKQYSTDDGEWLAFCYVNDELDGDDLVAFESRLLHDQALRELVENSVRQTALLAGALHPEIASARGAENDSQHTLSPRVQRGRKRWFVTLGVVATVLLVGLLLSGQLDGIFKGLENGQPTELALADDLMPLDELLFQQEEYATRWVDGMMDDEDEYELEDWNDPLRVLDSVTLQGDWMLELYSELGDEWDEWDNNKDEASSTARQTDRRWG